MHCAMRGLTLVALFWTVSTERISSEVGIRVRSLQKYDHHVCNAVQIGSEFFLTSASCLSARDPVEFELFTTEVSPKVTSNAQCNVTKYQSHPKYIFLTHNIALMQAQCGQRLGVNKFLHQVYAHVQSQKCYVCQKEYAVFDCKRQFCLKPTGKIFQKLSTVEGLAGAGIFTQNAKLVGILSYGFANGSLVAERVIYYKQFLHRTMQEFKRGKNNSPTFQ